MLKPYDGYKKTSIPWLEEVPSHWDENRAKNLYKKENRDPLKDDEVVTCFRDGQVTLRKNRRTTGFTESIKEHGYQHIDKGDLVIHVMDAFAGAVGVSDSIGKGTPVYSVCTSKVEINNYFYAYIIREMAKTGFIQSLYRGIRERSSDFRFEVFAMQSLPVPPKQEQDQIVKYLDWQTSKINTLIKAKKKQIELLKEQKQAVINKAVTKGLDDTGPMKDSGIEWLGEVPEHWDVNRLKNGCKMINRGVTPQYTEDVKNAMVVNQATFSKGYWDISKIRYTLTSTVQNRGLLQAYDVLLASTGGGVLGKVYHYNEEGIFIADSHVTIIRCNEKLKSKYVYYNFSTKYDLINAILAQGSTNQTELQRDWLVAFYFPFPPIQEQQSIVTYLEEKTAHIDKAIAVIEKEIELVSEYKTSLISSVVTGKVDVRDVIVPEFEVVEDEISEDDEGLEVDMDDSN